MNASTATSYRPAGQSQREISELEHGSVHSVQDRPPHENALRPDIPQLLTNGAASLLTAAGSHSLVRGEKNKPVQKGTTSSRSWGRSEKRGQERPPIATKPAAKDGMLLLLHSDQQ